MRTLGKGVSARIAPLIDAENVGQILALMSIDAPHAARYRAARVVVLSTASFSQWKGVKAHGLPSNEAAFRVLSDRRPEWLDQLVELVCDEEDRLNQRRPLIRRLVREGYCRAPGGPRYIDLMLASLQMEASRKEGGLAAVLLDDPGLLEYEIWRIFDTEPGPRTASLLMPSTDAIPAKFAWDGALAQLAREGRIARERLLDAALDGLSRDMHELRARWFASLHDRLEPTLDERAAQSARYVDFLASRNPSTVGFALKVLKGLLKEGRLDPDGFIDHLTPVFHARTKGTLKQALALLDLAVGRSNDSAIKSRAVLIATDGLVHEATDIQAAILDFIEHHGDSESGALEELLTSRLDSIAVSLRGRLAAWLKKLDEPPSEECDVDDLAELMARAQKLDGRLASLAGVPEALSVVRAARTSIPALCFDGTEIPRLDPAPTRADR